MTSGPNSGWPGLAPLRIRGGLFVGAPNPQQAGLAEIRPEELQYFGKLLERGVDEAALAPEEAKERAIMKLLLRIKAGMGAGLHPQFGAPEWRGVLALELSGRTSPPPAAATAQPDFAR